MDTDGIYILVNFPLGISLARFLMGKYRYDCSSPKGGRVFGYLELHRAV